jgi:hypothetical protein
MVDRVLELKHLLEGDSLAKSVVHNWTLWKDARSDKEAEILELRNYITATDTRSTSVGQNTSWKNSTTIPKLTQIRDNLHANYMSAVLPNDQWLRWEAYTQNDDAKEKRRAITAYMDNKIRESGFRSVLSKLIYDWIDTGNVFADVEFVREYKEDPVTGEQIPGYIGPRVRRLSFNDTVFNPTSTSFDESPKITRVIKTLGELERDAITKPGMAYAEDVIQKVKDNRSTFQKFNAEDFEKAAGYTVDGFGNLEDYYGSGYVELLEFEGDCYDPDTGDYLQDHIITVVDRQFIIRKIQNPSWLGTSTKKHCGWRDRPDNLYAMGPLDNLVGLQYRLDHLENLKADALDLTIHPPLIIKGDVEPFVWGPFEEIRIPDDGDVRQEPPNAAAFQVNNEIGYIMALMEEMAGAPKEAMGIRTPGEKTAFEVQQLQNAAGRIFQDKITKFETEFLEPLLNTMLEVARRNMDGGDLVRVMDDDLGVIEFMNITKEDITAKGKLRPIGARHFAARAQMVQNLTGIANSTIWQYIAPHISSKALARQVEQLLQFERLELVRDNVAVFEQAETQSLVAEARQELEVQSMTPGTEGEAPVPEEGIPE